MVVLLSRLRLVFLALCEGWSRVSTRVVLGRFDLELGSR